MRTSVSASTDDVASSSTSTSGSTSEARTSATSWRSPADSCSPRCADLGVQTVGQRVQPVVEVERRRRLARGRRWLSTGRAKPRLAAIVSSNRNGSWGTTTRRVRSSSLATAVSGTPPRRIVPDGRVGEAGDQAAERGLAGPGRADDGDLLAGGDRER